MMAERRTKESIVEEIKNKDVEFIRLQFCDLNGG